jgi:putative ABC transport system permease protein
MRAMTERRATGGRPAGARAFFFAYLRRELRRRMRQTLLVAAGLAAGVGLVVTVTAAAAGVSAAEAAVLHSLYGAGTDITVTTAPPATGGSAGNGMVSPGTTPQHKNELSVVPGVGVMNASAVALLSRLRGVAAAAGGLTLGDSVFDVPSAARVARGGGLGSVTSFTVDGVDLAHLGLGPFASAKIISGRAFTRTDSASDAAVVDAAYAAAHRLSPGSAVSVAGVSFTVIGLAGQAPGGGAADVYIPLGRAQALAGFQGTSGVAHQVDAIYVAATSAADVAAVQAGIARLLPSATVTSSGDLARRVSGSLASAASLATDLGRWLAAAVLVAAFAVASLLTTGSVTRRVGEIGTLKALGWKSRRIIAQILAEAAATGVLGAITGIAIGSGGAAVISALAPPLSATVAQNPGSAPPQGVTISGGTLHRVTLPNASRTVAVHMHAPVHPAAIAVAAALALAGALIAGSLAAWRATRLSPAEALTNRS